MATIKEIAEKAGVSIGTVDRVLHDRGDVKQSTKDRVLQAIQELQYTPNAIAQGLAMRKKHLEIVFLTANEEGFPFFADINSSARLKAKELEQFGVTVSIFALDIAYPKSPSPDAFDDALSRADGFVIHGAIADMFRESCEVILRSGRPIVSYSEKSSAVPVMTCIQSDYRQAGRIAAGLCSVIGGEHPRICFFSQALRSSLSSYDRLYGMLDEIRLHYPASEVVETYDLGIERSYNQSLVEDMLSKHPETNIVYVANPGDYTICSMVRERDPDHRIRIVANDLTDTSKKLLLDGTITFIVGQRPREQAARSIDVMFQYLAYNVKPVSDLINTDLDIFMAQNV